MSERHVFASLRYCKTYGRSFVIKSLIWSSLTKLFSMKIIYHNRKKVWRNSWGVKQMKFSFSHEGCPWTDWAKVWSLSSSTADFVTSNLLRVRMNWVLERWTSDLTLACYLLEELTKTRAIDFVILVPWSCRRALALACSTEYTLYLELARFFKLPLLNLCLGK